PAGCRVRTEYGLAGLVGHEWKRGELPPDDAQIGNEGRGHVCSCKAVTRKPTAAVYQFFGWETRRENRSYRRQRLSILSRTPGAKRTYPPDPPTSVTAVTSLSLVLRISTLPRSQLGNRSRSSPADNRNYSSSFVTRRL